MNSNFQTKFNEMGTHKLEGSFNYRNRDGKENETDDEYETDENYNTSGTFDYLSRVISKTNSNSNEYRLKLDYTLPLKDNRKFEAGMQSRIENEGEALDFKSFNTESQQFENNPMFTSSMDFKEQIHAVYSTYTSSLLGIQYRDWETDRKSTRLNSSHITRARMPSSA